MEVKTNDGIAIFSVGEHLAARLDVNKDKTGRSSIALKILAPLGRLNEAVTTFDELFRPS